MNRFLLSTITACTLVFLGSFLIYAQSEVTYISFQFFESGLTTPPRAERNYTTYFTQSEARYIYFEVELPNNLYNIRDHDITIRAEYYHPDGSLLGNFPNNYTISSAWKTSYNWAGWGWENAGNWDTGTYRVNLYLDGNYLGTNSFTITDTRNTQQYSGGGEDTWDGEWRGTIYHDDGEGSSQVRIVINGKSATQYFQNDYGSWDPVTGTDEMISEYYRNNFLLAWINHAEVWTETQVFSLSWKSRGVAEVVWTRHVNNKKAGENETWFVKGSGTLVRY